MIFQLLVLIIWQEGCYCHALNGEKKNFQSASPKCSKCEDTLILEPSLQILVPTPSVALGAYLQPYFSLLFHLQHEDLIR